MNSTDEFVEHLETLHLSCKCADFLHCCYSFYAIGDSGPILSALGSSQRVTYLISGTLPIGFPLCFCSQPYSHCIPHSLWNKVTRAFVVRWPHVPRGKCGLGASHMQEGEMGGINVPQSNTICQDILWFRFHRLYVPTRLQGQSLSARMAPYRVFQMRAVCKYPLPVPASLSSLNSCLPLHTLSLLHTKERLV